MLKFSFFSLFFGFIYFIECTAFFPNEIFASSCEEIQASLIELSKNLNTCNQNIQNLSSHLNEVILTHPEKSDVEQALQAIKNFYSSLNTELYDVESILRTIESQHVDTTLIPICSFPSLKQPLDQISQILSDFSALMTSAFVEDSSQQNQSNFASESSSLSISPSITDSINLLIDEIFRNQESVSNFIETLNAVVFLSYPDQWSYLLKEIDFFRDRVQLHLHAISSYSLYCSHFKDLDANCLNKLSTLPDFVSSNEAPFSSELCCSKTAAILDYLGKILLSFADLTDLSLKSSDIETVKAKITSKNTLAITQKISSCLSIVKDQIEKIAQNLCAPSSSLSENCSIPHSEDKLFTLVQALHTLYEDCQQSASNFDPILSDTPGIKDFCHSLSVNDSSLYRCANIPLFLENLVTSLEHLNQNIFEKDDSLLNLLTKDKRISYDANLCQNLETIIQHITAIKDSLASFKTISSCKSCSDSTNQQLLILLEEKIQKVAQNLKKTWMILNQPNCCSCITALLQKISLLIESFANKLFPRDETETDTPLLDNIRWNAIKNTLDQIDESLFKIYQYLRDLSFPAETSSSVNCLLSSIEDDLSDFFSFLQEFTTLCFGSSEESDPSQEFLLCHDTAPLRRIEDAFEKFLPFSQSIVDAILQEKAFESPDHSNLNRIKEILPTLMNLAFTLEKFQKLWEKTLQNGLSFCSSCPSLEILHFFKRVTRSAKISLSLFSFLLETYTPVEISSIAQDLSTVSESLIQNFLIPNKTDINNENLADSTLPLAHYLLAAKKCIAKSDNDLKKIQRAFHL